MQVNLTCAISKRRHQQSLALGFAQQSIAARVDQVWQQQGPIHRQQHRPSTPGPPSGKWSVGDLSLRTGIGDAC
jgi:hypothetical protein